MKSADDLFDQSLNSIRQMGLTEIPFTESPTRQLDQIFTGRSNELTQVFQQFASRERRRILVYGKLGIGKSAFLLAVLAVLRRKLPQLLTAYISLPPELDLATTALIALAREMPNDEWAQRQLYQMGIPTEMTLKDRTSEANVSMVFGAKLSEKDLPITKPAYPTVSFETLLERAHQTYSRGVVIAIDDLDKQNPSRVRQLMHDAQGTLKGKAWFMLTAHPNTLTGDLLTTERGLFDLQLPLQELDLPTTYQMLINYLNSVRINPSSTDPQNPRSVLPFLPETAQRFCQVTLGKPRLFNRLGNIVLSTAANLQATTITPQVLAAGLKAAQPSLLQKAALTAQEERVRQFVLQKGRISDETTLMEELQKMGFRSYAELVPILERLEEADLAYRLPQADAIVYEPLALPPDP